ncbi:MAG: glycosyltransferase family 4 protein, partial [Acutalibacteraceae bacterium]|nr:glycosyltransferase family 4 protein [Acutalibacteraceae bacterium]
LKRVIYSIALAKKLNKIIKNENDEVLLHFHNQYNLYFFLKLLNKSIKNKVKIAYTVHSYIWAGEWEDIKSIVKKRYFQEICCVRNADYVLVLNDITKDHFTKHFGINETNIFKVINGVNTKTYHQLTAGEIDSQKTELGLESKHIIFQVGSVCDRKNQLGAVKMLCEYLKKHKDTIYMYAGGIIDPDYQQEIINYSKSNNIHEQVIYVGELCPGYQLNKYYNIADFTIFPSRLESFGLVIIESLSAGTPVLLLETPIFDLNSGYRVFESESELYSILDEKAMNNKDFIPNIEKYSWESVARDHIGLFESKGDN